MQCHVEGRFDRQDTSVNLLSLTVPPFLNLSVFSITFNNNAYYELPEYNHAQFC